MKRKTVILCSLFAVLLICYIASLKSQLSQASEITAAYKRKIDGLETLKDGASFNANSIFLNRFFTYSNIKQRNETIKPLMTDKGYQMVLSGSPLDSSSDVQGSAEDVNSYEQKISKDESQFMNDFDMTMNYNHFSNTVHVFAKTTLLYIKGEGWKVDNIDFIGQINSKQQPFQ